MDLKLYSQRSISLSPNQYPYFPVPELHQLHIHTADISSTDINIGPYT